ncbi:MAG: TIM barrel protein [Cucumibacter sp.]
MVAPRLAPRELFSLARALGIAGVELRNDIAGNAILDGTAAADIALLAERAGVEILSINALQKFNRWNAERANEAEALIGYARECGAKALVLVPGSDGTGREPAERVANLAEALAALRPMLAQSGVMGLVEPLGFGTCSLRSKREAVAAIEAAEGTAEFSIVHDTFHHALAGEPEFFAETTGLVHISGVVADLPLDALRDEHRVLVGARDRIGNIDQIAALIEAGYAGRFSFEPFAPEVHRLTAPAVAIGASMNFIEAQLMERAA